jgi:fatty-acyl-CoA synthase
VTLTDAAAPGSGAREPARPGIRYDELVQPTRVHGSLYTSPEVFADELAEIWYRTWVFVGHVSEIAEPNDYVRKNIGPQDVILTRSADGEVHVLLNRCAHRANLVCEAPRGNSSSFRCPYHGWTYRNTGDLLGYPYKAGYGGRGRVGLGLGVAPRVAVHQGFVFASLASDGPTLAEHLGAAAGEIDRLVRLSPEGEIEVTAGWLKHRARANWKLLAENETDGYHPQFVHSSIFSVAQSGIGELYGDRSTAVTRALGNGHSENDLRPEFRKLGMPMGWFGTTEAKVPDYVARMRSLHGSDAEEILIDGAPHVMIFPNLFIAEIQMFTIQPLAADLTVQHVTAVQLKGAPEMNRRMLQQCIGSVGPAGLLLADDTEMYERNQVGVAELRPEWLDVRRGLHRERVDERGLRVGHANDETAMRGFWAHYRDVMAKGRNR